MSRRDQIKLTPEEQLELLDEERVVVARRSGRAAGRTRCRSGTRSATATSGPGPSRKSQKVKNLERDPRCTLLVETGVEYGELRGIQIEAEAELIRDLDEVFEFAKRADDPLRARASTSIEGDAAAGLGRRRRSGSRSTSTRSAPRPGITASSAAPTDAAPMRGPAAVSLPVPWRRSKA